VKRAIVFSLAILVACTGPVVRAEDQSLVLTDEQIGLIRTNCVETQSTLERVHASDALARVNLGQRYETISTKLMAPMNSRIALNRLDGLDLAKTTVDFNTQLDDFRSLYQQYEQTLLRTIQLKCRDQPVAFYDTLSLARNHREAVHESVKKLNGLIIQYGTQYEAFKSELIKSREQADGQ
jgi:hypothetical protein